MAKASKTTKTTAAKAAAKSAKPTKKAAAKKPAAPKAAPHLAREHLPIPDPKHVGLTTYDAKDPNTKYPPITTLRPPEGAPNVLIVLIDDVGFGASSAFGGPCNTPVAERLAANGLKLNRFHTTALCSPTRQAMLTGRNHHSVGMGAITEMATSAPGNNSIRPKEKAPIAETLRLNGYSTGQFGKCHEVPVWEVSPAGPFHQWPTGSGFEYFYGFVGGEANQYYPGLYEGTTAIEPPKSPEEGYTLTEDLAEPRHHLGAAAEGADAGQAVLHVLRAWRHPRPASGAQGVVGQVQGQVRRRLGCAAGEDTQAAEEAGRGAQGCRADQARTTRFPAGMTCRTTSSRCSPDRWRSTRDSSSRPTTKWAGSSTRIDDLGVLDDTLIYYIIGDNGASAEGTLNGCFNEMTTLNGMPGIETTEFLLSKIDDFGTPKAYNHYAVGWAHALCAPYQWTKQVASHWGGTRNGTIVHWPNGLADKGETRNQFHHVIDVAPTILEAAGLPAPTVGERHHAGAAGGCQHAVHAARRRRARDARRAVLRDDGQSRYLPPGLDGGDQAPHTVEGRHPAAVRRRRVGAVRSRRLDPGA